MSQPIEFLCNGQGAKASDVEAAISDLLNMGNECQTQYELSIAALKLIDWKNLVDWNPEVELTDLRIYELVDELRTNSTKLLFTLPTEPTAAADLSHPSFRLRILYLWKNRRAIEQ